MRNNCKCSSIFYLFFQIFVHFILQMFILTKLCRHHYMLSWQTSPTLMPTDCSVPSTLTIIYNYFLFHKTTCVIYSISECSIINFNLHFVTLPSNSISSKSPDILSTLPKPYFLCITVPVK